MSLRQHASPAHRHLRPQRQHGEAARGQRVSRGHRRHHRRGSAQQRRVCLRAGARGGRRRDHDGAVRNARPQRATADDRNRACGAPEGSARRAARGQGGRTRGARPPHRSVADLQDQAPDRPARTDLKLRLTRMDKVTKLFDCHSHWGTKRGYLFRTEAELAQQEKIWGTKATFLSEDEMADYFRRSNARVILDLSFTKFLPIAEIRAHQDYAFDFQRKKPEVVFGHWLPFDPRRALEAVREFDRALAANAGFVGLCVNGQVLGIPASDPRWDPIYQLAIEVSRPVMILTGLTGIGQGLPGGKGIVLDDGHPRHIDEVAARYPDLRILAARPAYPWQDEMLAVLAHKPNVSYELHGWGPRQYSPALKKAIAGRLAHRVMFGCDFPVLRYEKVIADWNAEGYGREVLENVLYRNAEAYFSAV